MKLSCKPILKNSVSRLLAPCSAMVVISALFAATVPLDKDTLALIFLRQYASMPTSALSAKTLQTHAARMHLDVADLPALDAALSDFRVQENGLRSEALLYHQVAKQNGRAVDLAKVQSFTGRRLALAHGVIERFKLKLEPQKRAAFDDFLSKEMSSWITAWK